MKFKKIFSLLAAGLAFFGMTSCSDDNDSNPVINTAPTTFVLNTPTMSEQYIELSESNTVSLSWSQPDYGFAALATYFIQAGVVQPSGDITWSNDLLEGTYTTCYAEVSGKELAQAINDADGFKSEEDYKDMGVRQIAVRVMASILDGENAVIPITKIYSNTVIFKMMQSYKAIKAPKKMYIIGQCSGWKEPADANKEDLAEWIIMETGVGTGIYQGTYDIPAGTFQLRFYTALSGWDGGASIGSQEADANVAITMSNGVYEGTITAPGKGNWQISDWEGGLVKITVNMEKLSVKFEKQ